MELALKEAFQIFENKKISSNDKRLIFITDA